MLSRKPMFKTKINRRGTVNSLLGIIFGISFGVGFEEYYGIGSWHSFDTPTENLNICFTPPRGCGSLIAQNIIQAKESVLVQAYSLTSFAIINQLIAAKARGVNVRAILDRSNFAENRTTVQSLRDAGIEVVKDSISGIAHNKVIIIDGTKVITGSFNFSEAADKRNAENAILIQDKKIADIYITNWQNRYYSAIK